MLHHTLAGAPWSGPAMIARSLSLCKAGWCLIRITITRSPSGARKIGLSMCCRVAADVWRTYGDVMCDCFICTYFCLPYDLQCRCRSYRFVPCDWPKWCEEINGFDCAQVLRESDVVELPNGPDLRWRTGWVGRRTHERMNRPRSR